VTYKGRGVTVGHASLRARRASNRSSCPTLPYTADDIRAAHGAADYDTWVECRRCHRAWKAEGCILGVLHHYVESCERCEATPMQTTGTFPALSQPRPKPKPKSGGKKR